MKKMKVKHWTKQINRMLNNRNYSWAHDTLFGIRKTIKDFDEVTDKQVRAIKNIQNGRNPITNE